MAGVKRRCKRVVVTASMKNGRVFVYQRPISKNDRKREGRTLEISDGQNMMSFDGHGIRMLKRIFKDSGEYGKAVNRKTAKVMVLEPAD